VPGASRDVRRRALYAEPTLRRFIYLFILVEKWRATLCTGEHNLVCRFADEVSQHVIMVDIGQ